VGSATRQGHKLLSVDGKAGIQPDVSIDDILRDAVDGATAPVDGRTARAQRTRDAIVDACLELVGEDDVRPTGPRVASRAGVSVRSVFQHFDDLESLYAAVSERSSARVAPLIVPIDMSLPLDERILSLVGQRARVLEEISPVCRAASVHAPFSAELRRRLHEGHDGMRRQAVSVFEPELAALPPERRERFEDVIDAVTSWPNWNILRTFQGRSVERAAQTVELVLRSLLVGVDAAD
jgi:TetR/AcrR family transcriptional regulator, regulator of autoinduction and epiphytic fitness